MQNASLTLVGSGITLHAHLTHEAEANIRDADVVLYLVNDPLMKAWINRTAKRSESLDGLYFKYTKRRDCYAAITEHILTCLMKRQHVCVVLYGHPCVFSTPGLDAIHKAQQAGFDTAILPGISAEDCLFADLKIDPSRPGCLSYEATDFLLYSRIVDPRCHLILWQVDAIGLQEHKREHPDHTGLTLLAEKLLEHYPSHHEATLYEATLYPGFKPRIEAIPLHALPHASFTALSTLYLPPLTPSIPDQTMMKKLGYHHTH